MPKKSTRIEMDDIRAGIATKPPEQEELEKYATNELARLNVERKQVLKDKGMDEFFKFAEGETVFTLEPTIPRVRDGNFGRQAIFKLSFGNQRYDYSINQRSPVYRQLLEHLPKAPIKLKMMKLGEGLKTRQSVKIV